MSLFLFGEGKVTVCALAANTGGIVVIQNVIEGGEIGEPVGKLEDINLLTDAVLMFPTIEQAMRVANALIGKDVYDV